MVSTPLLIGGEERLGVDTFPVYDPAQAGAIVKPPPTTPLSSVQTLRHLVRQLPPGVLNVVTGSDGVLGPVVGQQRHRRHQGI